MQQPAPCVASWTQQPATSTLEPRAAQPPNLTASLSSTPKLLLIMLLVLQLNFVFKWSRALLILLVHVLIKFKTKMREPSLVQFMFTPVQLLCLSPAVP